MPTDPRPVDHLLDQWHTTGPWRITPDDVDLLAAEITNLRGERDAYEAALWNIYRTSGADTDGDTDPGAMIAGMGRVGFADAVLDAVNELAANYDDALDETSVALVQQALQGDTE